MIVKHPREYVVDKLQYALNPKTIAVVGASRYSTKVGYKVVDGLLTWGYKGKIYPVNPRADKVAGFTAYKTVKDIPDEIDLAFLAVPAHIVKSVLEDCVEIKVWTSHSYKVWSDQRQLMITTILSEFILQCSTSDFFKCTCGNNNNLNFLFNTIFHKGRL